MTLRELFQLIGVWLSDTTVAVTADQFFHIDWFKDGFEKLIEGNILDLTISQIAFILFLVLIFFWGLINDYTKLTALSVLIVAPALAGSCPAKMAAIDAALADGSAKNIDKVRSLRAAGEQLHKTGKHSESVKVLVQAMLLAGVSESSY